MCPRKGMAIMTQAASEACDGAAGNSFEDQGKNSINGKGTDGKK
jgi:hypothetical protein